MTQHIDAIENELQAILSELKKKSTIREVI